MFLFFFIFIQFSIENSESSGGPSQTPRSAVYAVCVCPTNKDARLIWVNKGP